MKTEDLELRIARLLRWGVFTAALFIFVGWLGQLGSEGENLGQWREYHHQDLISALRQALRDKHDFTVITYLGLGGLVLLPPVRVLMTALLLISQKEKVLGLLAFLVFVTLVASFSLGINIH